MAAFAGRTAGGYGADIHYAVIAYAGGYNAIFPGLTPFGSMTLTASHEIAEAATDPNVNYRALGWYDDYKGGEIGDINRYEALLNGYAVQSIINKNDVAYIPYGATTLRALDATGGSGFASHSGHTAAADARFRLPPPAATARLATPGGHTRSTPRSPCPPAATVRSVRCWQQRLATTPGRRSRPTQLFAQAGHHPEIRGRQV